ncbi:hypothetical protein [uncultured Mailhella sp.]|uniref:hypothetical protein n=1 Tax=uncultured Mailhella sp. TaxID=1981031 RepID=UPI00320A40C0
MAMMILCGAAACEMVTPYRRRKIRHPAGTGNVCAPPAMEGVRVCRCLAGGGRRGPALFALQGKRRSAAGLQQSGQRSGPVGMPEFICGFAGPRATTFAERTGLIRRTCGKLPGCSAG